MTNEQQIKQDVLQWLAHCLLPEQVVEIYNWIEVNKQEANNNPVYDERLNALYRCYNGHPSEMKNPSDWRECSDWQKHLAKARGW